MLENLLSIQQYATKHKMSTFAVIKLINAKQLKTVKKTLDNVEQEFIVDETAPSLPKSTHEVLDSSASSINYEVEFHKLLAKHLELQAKYDAMIEKVAKL